ncbi:MAG: hypothetical protein ABIR19_08435 [Ginsengibacter sp.]
MQKIIASYLVQKKDCSLAGIGRFTITSKPSLLDVANKQLLPPAQDVLFSNEDVFVSDDLVKYVSQQTNVSGDEASTQIHKWCQSLEDLLHQGSTIYFDSIGTLRIDQEGKIYLDTDHDFSFFESMPAERVIHKNEQHAMLVGDRETTSDRMNEFYNSEDTPVNREPWKIWAIVLFAVAIIFLTIYFLYHDFNLSGTGNQIKLNPADQPVLHEIK